MSAEIVRLRRTPATYRDNEHRRAAAQRCVEGLYDNMITGQLDMLGEELDEVHARCKAGEISHEEGNEELNDTFFDLRQIWFDITQEMLKRKAEETGLNLNELVFMYISHEAKFIIAAEEAEKVETL